MTLAPSDRSMRAQSSAAGPLASIGVRSPRPGTGAMGARRDRHAHHREVLLDRRRDRHAAARPVRADPALLTAYTYWIALAVTVLALATAYLLLRGRLGLVLTAIRDDEVAARSSGARVGLARMLVFIVAAIGCGAAGGVLAISQLQVQPSAVFSVQWTAEMAFAVIIGGLGTIEGPIIGTIVYIVLQQTLAAYNAWYLIILGLVAIAVALFARRGL